MKRILLTAAALAALCGPALAAPGDVEGTVNVTGHVTSKCVVIPGAGSTFTDTIALGELADDDGTLKAGLAGSTAASPAGSSTFRVNCNAATPTVTVSATRLDNDVAGAPTGYADVIDYTATVDADLAGGSTEATAYTTAAVLPAATVNPLADRLANAAGNIRVKVHGLSTASGALLTAGDYDSVVSVTIAPTT